MNDIAAVAEVIKVGADAIKDFNDRKRIENIVEVLGNEESKKRVNDVLGDGGVELMRDVLRNALAAGKGGQGDSGRGNPEPGNE